MELVNIHLYLHLPLNRFVICVNLQYDLSSFHNLQDSPFLHALPYSICRTLLLVLDQQILPQKVGNFDRNCLPFLFARKPLISGLFRYPATKKQPLRSYFRSGIFTFRLSPAPLSRTNRSHRGVLFNLRGIVLTEGNRSI